MPAYIIKSCKRIGRNGNGKSTGTKKTTGRITTADARRKGDAITGAGDLFQHGNASNKIPKSRGCRKEIFFQCIPSESFLF
jgi:hypothetical protein